MDMTHNVERRAHEAAASGVDRASQEASGMPRPASASGVREGRGVGRGAALTRRERRVKELLLKELPKLNHEGFGTLSYAEKQHLEKTLDVAFIDKELARMRKQLKWLPKLLAAMGVIFSIVFLGVLWGEGRSADGLQWNDFLLLLPVISGVASPFLQVRSLKRRIFIFEALRELSDAEESDVRLDEAILYADAIIERVVQRELEADDAYALPPPSRA